jgi:hypothetical protein
MICGFWLNLSVYRGLVGEADAKSDLGRMLAAHPDAPRLLRAPEICRSS